MNVWSEFFFKRAALTDAGADQNSVDDRIVADLGPRRTFDPRTNPEDAEAASATNNRARLDELREDLTRAEDEYGRHTSPVLLNLGLVVALGFEILGAILVMKAIGVGPNERLPLGIALALALIGITAVMAHATAKTAVSVPATPGTKGTTPPKRSVWTFVLLLAYSLFLGAITVVRIQSVADEEASQVQAIAQALLMLATCLGPAWIAEWLLRKRALSIALKTEIKTLKRRLSLAERAQSKAKEYIARVTREGLRWDDEAARRRALYATHHRLANHKGDTP